MRGREIDRDVLGSGNEPAGQARGMHARRSIAAFAVLDGVPIWLQFCADAVDDVLNPAVDYRSAWHSRSMLILHRSSHPVRPGIC